MSNNVSKMLLPKAIRNARQKRHWTQIDLAQQLNVSQGAISFWESGIESPSLEHLITLVTLLPEIFEQLAQQEAQILARLYNLERAVNSGKCTCRGCGCTGS
jgi:transcriptional regulator with XRE-family HTH domain